MSGEVTRKTQITETLPLLPCPLCGKAIMVTDCGYSAFNPGEAECSSCGRKWHVGYVKDDWEAGEKWNRFQPYAVEADQLQARIKEIRKITGI